jgi:hypothetical protein
MQRSVQDLSFTALIWINQPGNSGIGSFFARRVIFLLRLFVSLPRQRFTGGGDVAGWPWRRDDLDGSSVVLVIGIGGEVAWVAPLRGAGLCGIVFWSCVLFDRYGNLKRYVGGLVHFDGSAFRISAR